MRLVFGIIGVLITELCFAQLTIRPIQSDDNAIKARTTSTERSRGRVNPASLPFWDDFSISEASPDSIRVWNTDTTRQWNHELSKDVFVNSTLAINPPSYRVATLDGLRSNGAFHGTSIGITDQLVSDTIDLQGKANVVLSFYWQAGGNVEVPDKKDSLFLEFYNVNTQEWERQWEKGGEDIQNGEDTLFVQDFIRVPSAFLNQRFLFRFQSYGDQDGPFDAWHVDWIYLNDGRANDDFFYEGEVSLNSEVSLSFAPFKSIPSNQLDDQEISDVSFSSMNLNIEEDDGGPALNYDLIIQEVIENNTITTGRTFAPFPERFFNQNPFLVTLLNPLVYEGLSFNTINGSDSIVLQAEVSIESTEEFLDGTQIDLLINDTVRTQYLLHNYYAFDDGTAEYAAGTNVSGGQLALQYWLTNPDTLTHIDIYFPNIEPSSADAALTLNVFKKLEDGPARSQPIQVVNGTAINAFTRYALNRPIALSDTFYIGFEQSRNEYIGVGLDRSNPAASRYLFENRTGVWERNVRISGALMMRPVFIELDSILPLSIPKQAKLTVYPNPTDGILKIDGDYQSISVLDFSGRVLFREEQQPEHTIYGLEPGLYLLTIHRKEEDQTIKIIKK